MVRSLLHTITGWRCTWMFLPRQHSWPWLHIPFSHRVEGTGGKQQQLGAIRTPYGPQLLKNTHFEALRVESSVNHQLHPELWQTLQLSGSTCEHLDTAWRAMRIGTKAEGGRFHPLGSFNATVGSCWIIQMSSSSGDHM